MSTTTIPLRFKYSGTYTDPARHHFGGSEWISEAEIRLSLARMIRDPAIVTDSLHIVVQQKKDRWAPLKDGCVADIFPELLCEYHRECAINLIALDATLPRRVRTDIDYALKHGVAQGLVEARQLVSALEKLAGIQNAIPETVHAAAPLPPPSPDHLGRLKFDLLKAESQLFKAQAAARMAELDIRCLRVQIETIVPASSAPTS